ncbi:DUF1707 domain-containing protein [Tessaracoccus sp. MC1865]|uniref:DUF1707 SHOCT-like domain-containing protein n=1 Tax=Tessaracoccus sp. MC1865 TaxID=2760310 RepID=UPI0016044DC3|nr:DUF1707 domain-containing protein [Tessaracoccus sp. MC1865]MBB1482684.1 DUF1707 domain-containing protein [Tessaracoccus sp. MC1865]QTO37867.1 DUF1707 domain-containing protein [Tessaracoccus sp. MC1865]
MDNLQLRIGDLERNEAVGFLQTHAEQGRLSSDEFNERIGNALTARTLGELASLFSDLPAPKPGPASSLPAVPSPAPLQTPPPPPYAAPHQPPSPYGPPQLPPPYPPPMYAHQPVAPVQQVFVNQSGPVGMYRKYNSFWVHLLLFFLTGGIGNIIYAWYIWDWNTKRGY